LYRLKKFHEKGGGEGKRKAPYRELREKVNLAPLRQEMYCADHRKRGETQTLQGVKAGREIRRGGTIIRWVHVCRMQNPGRRRGRTQGWKSHRWGNGESRLRGGEKELVS